MKTNLLNSSGVKTRKKLDLIENNCIVTVADFIREPIYIIPNACRLRANWSFYFLLVETFKFINWAFKLIKRAKDQQIKINITWHWEFKSKLKQRKTSAVFHLILGKKAHFETSFNNSRTEQQNQSVLTPTFWYSFQKQKQ